MQYASGLGITVTGAVSEHERLQEAILLHQADRLEEAKTIYEALLQAEPGFIERYPITLQLLGSIYYQHKSLEAALELFQKAVTLEPESATLHYYLGLVNRDHGQAQAALESFIQCVSLMNDASGDICQDACQNLATLAKTYGQGEAARQAYTELVRLEPRQIAWRTELARVYEKMNRPIDALAQWLEASLLQPDSVELLWEVANTLFKLGRLEEAAPMLQHVLSLAPDHAMARLFLAQCQVGLGNTDAARQLLQTLYDQTRNDSLRIMRLLAMPVIFESSADIARCRMRIADEIQMLKGQNLKIQDPATEIGMTPFFLTYQGQDDRVFMTDIARIIEGSMATRLPEPLRKERSRPKIGFISRHLNREHTIKRIYGSLIKELNPDMFEMVLFSVRDYGDPVELEGFYPNMNVVTLEGDHYWEFCDTLLKAELDLLFYTDIGMDPTTYFLAMQRLAPRQCVTWGHPVTTGITAMDYYISSRWLDDEPERSQPHYREKLIRMDEIPMLYSPVARAEDSPYLTKAQLGFGHQEHLYICPQSLFKFHPDFDPLLFEILNRDPDGKLLIFAGEQKNWLEQLYARWEKGVPNARQRIVQIPRKRHSDFLNLLAISDVMLDIPTFNGGNTSLDALSVGLPVVSLEGPLMKNRLTSGMLRRIDVTDTIVHDSEAYVSKVLDIAASPDLRQGLKQQILSRHAPLYNNLAAARSLEQTLIEILGSA